MIKRCTNPNAFYYHRYGGRGIFVCERWNSFENFLADMGQRPSPRHSINRKDNDGPYSPENCCWSIQRDQMNNMARNHPITAFGETLNVFQWAERTGLCESTIRRRIKDGWEPEQALSEAPRDQRHQRNNRSITAFGETLLLIDWSRRSGIQSATILSRIKSGWDPERAVTEPAGTSRRGPKPK